MQWSVEFYPESQFHPDHGWVHLNSPVTLASTGASSKLRAAPPPTRQLPSRSFLKAGELDSRRNSDAASSVLVSNPTAAGRRRSATCRSSDKCAFSPVLTSVLQRVSPQLSAHPGTPKCKLVRVGAVTDGNQLSLVATPDSFLIAALRFTVGKWHGHVEYGFNSLYSSQSTTGNYGAVRDSTGAELYRLAAVPRITQRGYPGGDHNKVTMGVATPRSDFSRSERFSPVICKTLQ